MKYNQRLTDNFVNFIIRLKNGDTCSYFSNIFRTQKFSSNNYNQQCDDKDSFKIANDKFNMNMFEITDL